MSTHPPLDVPKGTRHKCCNCDWEGETKKLDDIDDLWERLTAGGTTPSGQCPKCQAFTVPIPPKPKLSPYPEHAKLTAIHTKSQACGGFLEWLEEMEYVEITSRKRLQELLAEHFEIDEGKLEEEKRAMLDACRKLNKEKDKLKYG